MPIRYRPLRQDLNPQPVSRRDFTRVVLTDYRLITAGTLTGRLITFPPAPADSLLVVQWGANWIEVSSKITTQTSSKTNPTPDQLQELTSGNERPVVAKIKTVWPNTMTGMLSVAETR